jgi:hypothetical protein
MEGARLCLTDQPQQRSKSRRTAHFQRGRAGDAPRVVGYNPSRRMFQAGSRVNSEASRNFYLAAKKLNIALAE